MSTKILTVDDSKMVRMIIAKIFAPLGCQILEAGNGNDALIIAIESNPDLIFLDITMPDMSGLEVLAQMRGISTLQATPVVMLTAESGNSSIERADQLKVSGYVAKPFKSERLLELATQILPLQALTPG
jgi:two-component system chemotaxis response regulator CheY